MKGDYTPKAGYVVFYGPGGGSHTGIVLAYYNGYIYTIKGNYDGGVNIVRRPISSNYIYGFGSNGGTKSGKVPEKFVVDDHGTGRTQ